MEHTYRHLTPADLRIALPEPGGTTIVIQRAAARDRQADAREYARQTVMKLLEAEAPILRASADFLVVGSDPRIGNDGEPHKESLVTLETAREVLEGIREALAALTLSHAQLLNTAAVPQGDIVEISEIKGWQTYAQEPELFEFLQKKAEDTGEDLAMLYETDAYKEEREKLGAEGAKDVALRMEHFLSCTRGSANYHAAHPGRRLVMWTVTRFDTITPYLRTVLAHPAECTEIIPAAPLGGVTLNVRPDRTATIRVHDKAYATSLYYAPVTG